MSDLNPTFRGMMLVALHAQYPLALLSTALERQVLGMMSNDLREFERQIAYLSEKQMLVVTKQTIGAQEYKSYQLTSLGVDVVEGAVREPGITIVRR